METPPQDAKISPQEPVEEESKVAVEEVEVAEPKAPSKPFSWADMASKNTPAVRGNVQQGTVVKVNRPPPVEQASYELYLKWDRW